MIRTDHILNFFGMASVGLGAVALALVLTLRPDTGAQQAAIDMAPTEAAAQAAPERVWPPLFGVPPAAPVAEARPKAVPAANYTLKGLVAAEQNGWAIVTGPEGDQIVEHGTLLPDGFTVESITPQGVEIVRDNERLVIGFADPDASAPPVATGQLAVSAQLNPVQLSLRQLREDGFQRTLGLAGGTQIVDRGNGLFAQEIIWVRKGRFYDQLGLQKGDIVLTLNEIPAGDMDALSKATPQLLRERSFDVEILRAGARMSLEVIVDENL